jgi:hypothetical protein
MTTRRTIPRVPPHPAPDERLPAPPPPSPSALAGTARSPVSARSVALGLVGVVVVCGLTPYNDYALNNTFLVGNYLPLGVVGLAFLFAVFVNGPLWRWAPRQALTAGELTVALSMTLVSCALPSSGLMRYFPPSLVSPHWLAAGDGNYASLLESMNLPRWLLPDLQGDTLREQLSDPVIQGYLGRWTGEGGPPYRAWLRPALAWAIFIFALYGAALCLIAIVRRQWYENERLPFPLATIYLSLVEQPPPGRSFNGVLARRSFWVAFGGVFALHAWNGLSRSWPQYFPEIPVYYSLPGLFDDPPLEYVDWKLKDAAVFFTVAGVAYFLPTSVAFSLWFFFILHQVHRMILGTLSGDPTIHGQREQHFGALVAFLFVVLWIGRHHWALVVRQAFRGPAPNEPKARYLPYRAAFWGLVGCAAVMVAWLCAAGANLIGAVATVVILLCAFLLITRIIAETGLPLGQLYVSLNRPWQLILYYTGHRAVSLETFYLSQVVHASHVDYREALPVYAGHATKVADQTMFDGRDLADDASRDRRLGRRFFAVMAAALVLGYAVSFASTLWTEYHYAVTQDIEQRAPINDWGATTSPRINLLDPTIDYQRGARHAPADPLTNIGIGFGVALVLGALRLNFAWWPLHPIGFLMIETYPGDHLWLSVFVGWLAKVLILRFGGSKLYVDAKPFFLGVIVGESAAAGFWLVVGIVLSTLGLPYRPINIMPG